MPGDSSFRIISFGTFEVNLHTGELRQRGQKVKLQEQPFQVLAALLERPGELVTREELRSKLWPSDTFVDFDHGLNAAIKRLRDALGESADAPVFIETMARRGYRFIAPVDGGSTASGIETSAQERPKSTVVGKWIAVALLSSAVIAVLAWARWRYSWRSSEMTERKLTTNSSENSVTSAAVSRDGKYLAYTDSTGIYLKLISTGETHPLPLPPNFPAHVDDWFQDGSHLLVTRGELSLWSISLFGGSPRLLADDARAGSVSPDGSHIAFQRRDYGREEWVMRADGTDQLKVAADKSSWVGRPTWSPDGNRIAYIRDSSTYNAREASVEVNDWRKSNAQTLFSDNRLSPSVYWLPNDLLVYAIGDEENQQRAGLRTVSPQQTGKSAGSSKSITPRGIGWINQLTGSADGKILTFTRENSVVSAYIGALAPDGTHLLSNKRMTFDENKNEPFAWTPDSKAILFNSNRNGTSEIFRQATDEPLAESMMASAEQLQQPRVTPDGSEILFISTPKSATPDTPNSIVAIPISGGPPRVVLQDANIWNIQCASPPSALCLYSVSKGDTSETFRFDVKTGKTSGAPQVDPWCNWSLSPDGSRRAVVSCRKRNGVIRLRSALTGETHELVVKGWDELDSIVWSADGKTLFATWSHESETALLRVALDGTVSVLLRSSNPQIVGAVPSPDGRSLAIAEQTTARNVWQIENF
jgi:DNA-binding winged helix-turn-helix (wHTH) protein/Tol biopolymer transport system component